MVKWEALLGLAAAVVASAAVFAACSAAEVSSSVAEVSSSVATSTATATPSTGPRVAQITLADDGQTVAMQVGQRVTVALGEQYRWEVTSSDTAVISRLPQFAMVRGAQGIYEAHKAGQATLEATGTMVCAAGQPCPALARVFRVTVTVR